MAALYGRMYGEKGVVTRTAHQDITSHLETWDGSILTNLKKDGRYEVYIGEKDSPKILVATGNVNETEDA
jgi:hypothetical protein